MSPSKSGSLEEQRHKGAGLRTHFVTNETFCLYAELRTTGGILPLRAPCVFRGEHPARRIAAGSCGYFEYAIPRIG
jgi:hypothetical protein